MGVYSVCHSSSHHHHHDGASVVQQVQKLREGARSKALVLCTHKEHDIENITS